MKTTLFSIGISHHNTPQSLRERMSQPPEKLLNLMEAFARRDAAPSALNELAILSTCNRLELYACIAGSAAEIKGNPTLSSLIDLLCQNGGLSASEVEPYLFQREGFEAVLHLGRVAAGLDSMVIGEPQILGQVAQAHELALKAGSSGHILSALFRAAIHAGKRVRSEIGLGRHSSSVSSAAVRLAESAVDPLAGRSILVVGTGEMGKLALETLHKRGVSQVTVTSRTFEHASQAAQQSGFTAQPFERLPGLVADSDVVFTATSAPLPILERDLVARAMTGRPERPLALVDLGLPRNVERSVRDIPNVRLYDLDDLNSQVDQVRASLEKELPRAEAIVLEEARDFEKWLEIIPIVSELHRQAEAIRRREVERMRQRLPGLDPALDASIELFSQSLVKKLLHNPTMRLRKDPGGKIKDYSEALAVLFDLTIQEGLPPQPERKDAWDF